MRRSTFFIAAWGVLSAIAACSPKGAEPRALPDSPALTAGDAASNVAATRDDAPIRLVVFLTVDQLSPELLRRHERHFGPGGIRRLTSSGVSYANATFGHAITETAPGHATLFTGAAPREHGIVANSWVTEGGEEVESVDDPGVKLIGPGVTGEELGKSPKSLLVPTLADELIRQSGGAGRAVAISVKDRGAILPAGQTGSAYWLGREGFVTSTHYRAELPEWLQRFHAKQPLRSHLPAAWSLTLADAAYSSPLATHGPLGPSGFPHVLPSSVDATRLLKTTPFGDTLTLAVAEAALVGEALGQDDVPDLLAVSLSATDGIGHAFGPESREAEDNLIRLDRALANFIDVVERRVGAGATLWVLTADHGGLASSESLAAVGLRSRRLTEAALRARAEAISRELGVPKAVRAVATPYVVFDHSELRRAGRDALDFGRALGDELVELDGLFWVHPVGAALPGGRLGAQIDASIHPGRSGDLYLVPEPYTLLLQSEDLVGTHGSPWNYDTHVPLVFARDGASESRIERSVDVRSVAGTVLEVLEMMPPPAAARELCTEALTLRSPRAAD